MKLTEAKLKQMILEALRAKYDGTGLTWVDDNIPDPDQKLRATLGDEKWNKIRSLEKTNPDQALMIKQGIDDMYPRRTKLETIQSFMESHGFDLEIDEIEEFDEDFYKNETYIRNKESLTVNYYIIYRFSINHELGTSTPNPSIGFKFDYLDTTTQRPRSFKDKGEIKIPKMFELDFSNEEDINTASTAILDDQRRNLERIIGLGK